ncbi:UDP-N-acetylmuramoyl-tripeptide--D-alanyl-D-alanine ligase [Piscinibacterium candidicorallinum]|uniref:UDP-N-acetylmuramoyl-tripeptide--D-alanyl-D-alanine ligase n=1 Tax=Piscinibacterium candidicorallinum TaxID=1793872 RepID=A0ABV7H516_9BURK
MSMLSLRQAAMLLPSDCHATVRGDADTLFARVHSDTRSLQAGDLFVALKGERFDGNTFVAQAAAAGAVAALVHPDAPLPEGYPALIVADTKQALAALAHAWRMRFAIPLAVVTGSNGKTTTKEMIASIFRAAVGDDAVLATAGNFNNDIGLPLTLLRLRAKHRLAVIELGMNHPGETALLARIAAPTVALVNNAQREHQEFMATVEAVAQEHADALRALAPQGTAVFPADDTYTDFWRQAAGGYECLTFSTHPEADSACLAGFSSQNGLKIRIQRGSTVSSAGVSLNIDGAHNHHNALAAAAVAVACGLGDDAIVRGLESFRPAKGRMQRVGGLPFALIDDSYNANPDSVRAAIHVLAPLAGKRLLVLGDMGEVGDQGPAFHAEVGAYAAEHRIDLLVAMGEACREAVRACVSAGGRAVHVESLAAAVDALMQEQPGAGDTVLVKGSRFMAMERVVEEIKKRGGA